MSRNLLLYVFFLLYMILYPNYTKAINGNDELKFKDGTVISCSIRSVNAWAITLNDNNYYAIQSLSEIKTADSSVVSTLKKYYPDIVYFKSGEIYIINVLTLKLLPLDKYSDNILHRCFIVLNGMSSRAENIEFQINVVPRFWHHLVGQVAVSSGTNLKLNSLYIISASFGIGYIYSFDRLSVSADLNIANKTLSPDNVSKVVTYLSLYTQAMFFSKLLFSVGGRYYISNISIGNETTRFSLNIGVGYNFRITP